MLVKFNHFPLDILRTLRKHSQSFLTCALADDIDIQLSMDGWQLLPDVLKQLLDAHTDGGVVGTHETKAVLDELLAVGLDCKNHGKVI